MYKVAVLLAAYNGQKWIEEQINSILKQKDVIVNLYISCDISTDNTLAILNSYKDNKITILPYGKKFGAAAPNFYRLLQDVDFSDFDFIAFSDQDDIWLENKMISGINKLLKYKCDGYSSNVIAFWSDGRQKIVKKAYPQKKYDFLFESPGPGCSFVFTKKLAMDFKNTLIKKKIVLDKLDWHDWLLYAFARGNGYSWYIDKSSYMLYRQHENNQLGANSGSKQFIKRVKNITSGYGINQTINTVIFIGSDNDLFVKKSLLRGRSGYLYLACHSYNCRRRIIHCLFFFISCFIMFIINTKKDIYE